MASKSVAEKRTGEVSVPSKVLELKRILAAASTLPDLGGSAGAIIADIQNRILNADSIEAVFEIANSGAESVSDWVDKPIEIQDFRVLDSAPKYKNDESLDAYMAVAFVDLTTGEQKVLTAGGTILVPLLWRFRELNALPLQCAFTETTTSRGYTVHKLRPLTDTERSGLEKAAF